MVTKSRSYSSVLAQQIFLQSGLPTVYRRVDTTSPLEALARRFPASLENLKRALPLVDRFYLFDNSDRRRRLLAVGKGGQIVRVSPDFPRWADDVLA